MNGRASKRKGANAEREVVHIARMWVLQAERAYASNGRSLGHAESVDVVIEGLRAQVKRRARIAEYIKPPDGADITLIREDRGPWLAVIPYTLLLDLLSDRESYQDALEDLAGEDL